MLAFLAVILAATVTVDLKVRSHWENSLREQIRQGLTEKAELFAELVESSRDVPIETLVRRGARATQARVTVIDRTGKVLADSEADAATMENHATRPEFIEALRGRTGSSVRFSHTLGVDFMYVAVPASGGAVRVADPLSAIQQVTAQARRALFWATAWGLLAAIVIAGLAAHSISSRLRAMVRFAESIAAGDLSARPDPGSFDEIGQVAAAFDKTARNLERSFKALEESRRQLETLLNSIQEGVVAVSADQKVRWANASLRRRLCQDVHEGAPLIENIRDPDVLEVIQETMQDGNVHTARAGSVVPGRTYDVTAAPMPGGGAVAVFYDLTKIERVERTRRDFIANVSHELRTPLTSIQGYAETLQEAIPPEQEEMRRFAAIIAKNAARMERLTTDLLTLARVESGEQKLQRQPLAARQLLDDAAENYRDAARAAGVELVVEDAAPKAVVRADSDAVQQVFANLVDNALKYGAAGGRIVVGAQQQENAVEFYVRDFGGGIASEHIPRLFERFYRVDKGRSREAGGTGLGLAIVKHIVLKHGGAVRAESELNHGATFYFTLPMYRGAGS